MKEKNNRRSFIKKMAIGSLGTAITPTAFLAAKNVKENDLKEDKSISQNYKDAGNRKYNETYKGEFLNRLAFPIGGIGAGMFCLEGTGAISHMSIRNRPRYIMSRLCFQRLK